MISKIEYRIQLDSYITGLRYKIEVNAIIIMDIFFRDGRVIKNIELNKFYNSLEKNRGFTNTELEEIFKIINDQGELIELSIFNLTKKIDELKINGIIKNNTL
jgi:hypothetical protein